MARNLQLGPSCLQFEEDSVLRSDGDLCDMSLADFHQRWRKARWSAWRYRSDQSEPNPTLESWESGGEAETILNTADGEEFSKALRRVYDYSRQLALGASKHFHMTLELADFARLVKTSLIPCATGEWQANDAAWTVRRSSCPWEAKIGCPNLCQWYREAIDGVVIGFGDGERYVRHRSRGVGDSLCEDVYYLDQIATPALRLGALDSSLDMLLRPVVDQFAHEGWSLKWMGYSAGTLFYHLQGDLQTPSCQSPLSSIKGKLHGILHRLVPDIRLQDVGPMAVFGDNGSASGSAARV